MRPRGRTRHLNRYKSSTENVSIPASSREDATVCRICGAPAMPFQSPRPRGRTRRIAAAGNCRATVSIPASSRDDATLCPVCLFVAGHVSIPVPLQSRNLAISQSRNLAISQSRNLAISQSRNLAISQSRNLAISQSRNLAISQSRNLAISQSRNLAISQSRNLAISQSRNLAIMDCSLQAAGERKVKTMAKICQAETAIRGSLRVHDKRKPLNARRMPMHSFVSTPLQGTLDPME